MIPVLGLLEESHWNLLHSRELSWAWRAKHIVIFFKCSGAYFLPASLGIAREPSTGKVPEKSKPQNVLLWAPGCLCFRPKGMGGTRSTFPFWTVFYFWACLYLNTYTQVYACMSFFSSRSKQYNMFLSHGAVSVYF